MNKLGTTVLLAVALGAGWLLGSQTGPGAADMTAEEYVRLQEENARLRRTLGERGPTLKAGAGLGGTASAEDPGANGVQPEGGAAAPSDVTDFDITQFDDADKAFQAMLAYAAAMLAKGEEGHFALLEMINKTFHEKEGERALKTLIGSDDEAVRYLYPMIRFAMNHDAQLVDMTETLFKTMAENPQRFAEIDDDPLEVFTEGIAVMLPGMVDAKRLERFRSHALGILETPEDRQPRSVQRQRRDIQRAVESWAPPVSSAEAAQRLRAGVATPEETLSLLGRLTAEDARGLDLDALVGPLLETHGWRVISVVGRLQPDPGTRAKFDTRILHGVNSGAMHSSMVSTWLRWTGRRGWAQGRDFIEAGLQGGSVKTNGIFVMAALGLRPAPDDDWVEWVETTYDLDDTVRLFLKRRRQR